MRNLKVLQTMRMQKDGNIKLNIAFVFVSILTIVISFWSFVDFASHFAGVQAAANLNETHWSSPAKYDTIRQIRNWLIEIYDFWFSLCFLTTTLFTAALCINCHNEFSQLEQELRSLVESSQIYTDKVFGHWRRKFEQVSDLVEGLGMNIGPFLCCGVILPVYFILATIYHMLQDCDTNWVILTYYFLKLAFPLFALVLPTVAVNEKVRTCNHLRFIKIVCEDLQVTKKCLKPPENSAKQ